MTPPPPTRDEIRNLLGIARRSLADAAVGGVSPDGRFELSYAAALAAATAALRSEGERIHGSDHHRLTFDALRGVAAGRWSETARFLQHCRGRRNAALYDRPGVVSAGEAEELRRTAEQLVADIERWLREAHPDLAS